MTSQQIFRKIIIKTIDTIETGEWYFLYPNQNDRHAIGQVNNKHSKRIQRFETAIERMIQNINKLKERPLNHPRCHLSHATDTSLGPKESQQKQVRNEGRKKKVFGIIGITNIIQTKERLKTTIHRPLDFVVMMETIHHPQFRRMASTTIATTLTLSTYRDFKFVQNSMVVITRRSFITHSLVHCKNV